MLRLLRRGVATRTLSADEMIARGQFIKKSFQLFDLNSDKKIELHEVETAYLHNSAGSEVVRLLEETGELGGKGVTWELLVIPRSGSNQSTSLDETRLLTWRPGPMPWDAGGL